MLDACFTAGGQTQKPRTEGYMSTPFQPVSDGKTYINPRAGDATAIQEGQNGHYIVFLAEGVNVRQFLVLDKTVAEQINAKASMKLYLDERNIIVAVE